MGKLLHKPNWLRKKIKLSDLESVTSILNKNSLHSVCEEAMCPNIGECFSKRQATFLIMGNICTRHCSFCNVGKGKPLPLNEDEPENLANAIRELKLSHIVITSPTRDDLSDGGAGHFVKVVSTIKAINEDVVVELLIPDMNENINSLKIVANSGAEIIGHNLETVPRLYSIRKGASYNRSLRVLKELKELNPKVLTKSGIMLGLGEKRSEVIELMKNLLSVECKYLSIGQYLAPSPKHTKVIEYIEPKEFEFLKRVGMEMGFKYIKSSPYTRSSYMAEEYLGGRYEV